MYSLTEISDLMAEYNRDVAPGSECSAWQDYVADCWSELGCGPGGHGPASGDGTATAYLDGGVYPPETFREYWLAVAAGKSTDYNGDTGDREY